MQLVETIEVGAGGAASIEFTSIPQDADDLLLVLSGRADIAAVGVALRFRINNDSGSNYTNRRLIGNGSSSSSATETSGIWSTITGAVPGTSATASTFGNDAIYLPNYTSSSAKSFSLDTVGENNSTESYQVLTAGLWNQTSAITSLQLIISSGNFVEHSTASLYKITKA